MSQNAIEMIGITKTFPGVIANDCITLSVRDNEIHALLGENGAGKSTLMSILFGSYEADAGRIRIRGHDVKIHDPNEATALRIGMVHQHFKLVENYTVTENIVLGIESRDRFGMLDITSAEKRVAQLSETYGLKVNPRDKIEDISVGMQQRVEILKTLYRNADILIFDEPSAVLTPLEIDELMEILVRLKSEGKTIILITHKLKEIKAVAERCTVLRRGRYIGTVDVADVSEQQLADMMVGRAVEFAIEKAPINQGPVVLKIDKLTVRNQRGLVAVHELSLDVHASEILGVAGVDGNGQTELIYAITGSTGVESGCIILGGNDITHKSVKKRIEAGIGHIPEDRHRHGLVLDFTVAENSVLKTYDKKPWSGPLGMLDHSGIHIHAENLIDQYDIRAGEGAGMKVRNMSGGNQQKVIIAREVDLSPSLLVVAQPTRGLDVGAIEYIRKRIVAERDKGRAILLISFELDEIINLCDRIAIISKGEIAGVFAAGEVDERQIGSMMAGASKDQALKEHL